MTMISTTMGKNSLEEMEKSESEVAQLCPTLCDPMDCSLLHPWDFPGKNTGVDCHFLLQEIFLTQGLNLGLPHCRQMLYRLSHQRRRNGVTLIVNKRVQNGVLDAISKMTE